MNNEKEGIPEAGRDLDVLVAEKVMGYRTEVRRAVWWGYGDWHSSDYPDQTNSRCIPVDNVKGWLPEYSTDIEAAWAVIEKLGEGDFLLWQAGALVSLGGPSELTAWCQFSKGLGSTSYRGEGRTAPHAICLAALKAVAPPSGDPNSHPSNSLGAPKEGTGA